MRPPLVIVPPVHVNRPLTVRVPSSKPQPGNPADKLKLGREGQQEARGNALTEMVRGMGAACQAAELVANSGQVRGNGSQRAETAKTQSTLQSGANNASGGASRLTLAASTAFLSILARLHRSNRHGKPLQSSLRVKENSR